MCMWKYQHSAPCQSSTVVSVAQYQNAAGITYSHQIIYYFTWNCTDARESFTGLEVLLQVSRDADARFYGSGARWSVCAGSKSPQHCIVHSLCFNNNLSIGIKTIFMFFNMITNMIFESMVSHYIGRCICDMQIYAVYITNEWYLYV